MMVEPHETSDGYQVWLDRAEVDALVETADRPPERLAWSLGAECGLRSAEIVAVTPSDVVDTDAGTMLRVPESKTAAGVERQTPIPDALAEALRTAGEYGAGRSEPVVDVTTRTLRNWMDSAGKRLADTTGDGRARYLSPHDLRRTWAGALANVGVDETVALRWGGWDDLDTFLDAYRGEATAAAQRRQREKVDWL